MSLLAVTGAVVFGAALMPAAAYATLEGSGSINGVVTNPHGRPIADFEVCAVKLNSKGEGAEGRCELTDSGGEYGVPTLPGGLYKVEFSGDVCRGEECAHEYVTQYFGDRRVFANGSDIELNEGEDHSGVDASVADGGRISGTVTHDSIKQQPIAEALICAFDETEGVGLELLCTETSAAGTYTIGGLQPGSVYIAFTGEVWEPIAEEPAYLYTTQYYNGKATLGAASPISVTEGETVSGISAALVERSLAKPVNSQAPALTGRGAVGATLYCSEGEWLHYPTGLEYVWKVNGAAVGSGSASSYGVAAADEGQTISCEVVASNNAGSSGAVSNTIEVAREVTTTSTTTSATVTTTSAGTTRTSTATQSAVAGSTQAAVIAAAVETAQVKGATALVQIVCPGTRPCEGEFQLSAVVTEKSIVERHGARQVVRHRHKAMIGTATFFVAEDGQQVVKVSLTKPGRMLVRHAPSAGVKVHLTGVGIRSATIVLKKRRG